MLRVSLLFLKEKVGLVSSAFTTSFLILLINHFVIITFHTMRSCLFAWLHFLKHTQARIHVSTITTTAWDIT